MNSKLHASFCAALLQVGLLAHFAPLALAQEDTTSELVEICAAVHPCNEDGSVFAPFNEGPCAEKYARECLGEQVNKVADQLTACQDSNESLQAKMRKLIRERKALRNRR